MDFDRHLARDRPQGQARQRSARCPIVPFNLKTLREAGVIRPMRPDKLARVLRELRRAGAPRRRPGSRARRSPIPTTAMIDDEPARSPSPSVHRRSNALAHALAEQGVQPGDGVAIMCRNHRGFVDATLAASKLGANALYMNTAFAGPQLASVIEREEPAALIYDDEFAELLGEAGERCSGASSPGARSGTTGDPTTDELIDGRRRTPT